MKAEIRWQVGTTAYEVWLFDPSFEGTRVYALDGSIREVREPGSVLAIKPSLTVDLEILKALVAAASKTLPPSAATERHLEDAIKVRDYVLNAYLPKESA